MKHLLLTTIAAVLLVGCGPSVDIWTAAQTGNIEAVNQHLADGVDVNSKNDIGRTPLDVAIAFKQSPIADLLRQHSGKTRDELKAAESIVAAIRLGNIEAIKQHLDDGTEVNAKDGTGRTPLHWASISGHKEAVELLIDNGADVNAMRGGGGTPLSYAASWGHEEIVELLIANGADVNVKDAFSETPLDVATHPDNPNASAETAALLRKHGGKIGDELKTEGK